MNNLRLTAQVVVVKPLRYTPAGVAVCEAVLQHQATVEQAHVQRQLNFELDAIAMGDAAQALQATQIGQSLLIQGFIAPLRKSSGRLVVHIQQLQHPSTSPTVLV